MLYTNVLHMCWDFVFLYNFVLSRTQSFKKKTWNKYYLIRFNLLNAKGYLCACMLK